MVRERRNEERRTGKEEKIDLKRMRMMGEEREERKMGRRNERRVGEEIGMGKKEEDCKERGRKGYRSEEEKSII